MAHVFRGAVRPAPCAAVALLFACGTDDVSRLGPVPDDRPRVVATVPEDGASVAASLSEMSVTFDQPMLDGSWSWVIETGQPFPEVTGDAVYVDATTNVIPVKVLPDSAYVVWINSPDNESLRNFQNPDGVPAVPERIRFTTF